MYLACSHMAFYMFSPQDYPSLALLGEKLAENNIFLIFAVTKRHYVLYKVLIISPRCVVMYLESCIIY